MDITRHLVWQQRRAEQQHLADLHHTRRTARALGCSDADVSDLDVRIAATEALIVEMTDQLCEMSDAG